MALAALDPSLHRWSPAHFGSHRDLLQRIQDRSRPHAACVCCSDVGTAPESASFVEPGQLFVIQNPGGCVSMDGQTLIPSIEYALGLLDIEHLIVCGHVECRLIRAALCPPKNRPVTAVEGRFCAELAPLAQRYCNPAESLPVVLAQEQVLLQLRTLVSSPPAIERLARGSLQLYGWLIDDRTSQVFGFNVETGQFEPLRFRPTP